MHELLQEIRIGISLGFRFPLAARRYVRCGHMELQFSRNLGASCGPCVLPVLARRPSERANPLALTLYIKRPSLGR